MLSQCNLAASMIPSGSWVYKSIELFVWRQPIRDAKCLWKQCLLKTEFQVRNQEALGALRPAARAFKVFSQCRKLCVLSVTGPFLTAV